MIAVSGMAIEVAAGVGDAIDPATDESRRLFRAALGATDYAVLITDADIEAPGPTIRYANAAMARLTGYAIEELVGANPRMLQGPATDGAVLDCLRADLVAHRGSRAETVNYRKDGSTYVVEWTMNPILDEAGRVEAWLAMQRDVTDLHRTRTALRESEARLAAIFANASVGLSVVGADGRFLETNHELRRILGRDADQLAAASVEAVTLPADVPASRAAIAAALGGNRAIALDKRYLRPDGSVVWASSTVAPLPDARGQARDLLVVTMDLTERKRAEDALRVSEERLNVLVAELQHRTRNLMGVVRSMADKTARSSADMSDFGHRFGDRLDALARVQGLLSRLDGLERVAFDDLLRTEFSALAGNAEQVRLDGPPGVRLRSTTVQMLAMALHELATNAVKYGALGQPDARLTVTWRLEAPATGGRPWLHIEWRETGVTLPADPAAARGAGEGRALIEQALPYQLGARTDFAFMADGVRCTIALPVSGSPGEAAEG